METYAAQDFPKDEWELIVIDDNSEDKVLPIVDPYRDRINLIYRRLDHDHGMRGNTVAFNTAFAMARGEVLAETTPETMFQPEVVRMMYELHAAHKRRFVSFKTFNLTPKIQLRIDQYDWRKNLYDIARDPDWLDPWVHNNFKTLHFGTHQTCSIRADTWWWLTKNKGFPLFCGYGEEDPAYCDMRRQAGVEDYTVMYPMPVHQWHPPFQYWMSRGRNAKHLNYNAHTTSNYMNDQSGHVPPNGTCGIFDHGDDRPMTEEEKRGYDWLIPFVRDTGCEVY